MLLLTLWILILIYAIRSVAIVIIDLANRKTTKETNESKSNWISLRGKSHPNEESQHVFQQLSQD